MVEVTDEPKRPTRIKSERLFEALTEAGIFQKGELVRRIVLDLKYGQPVLMYVERFGDDRLLNVVLGLNGAEIEEVPAKRFGGAA